MTGEEKKEFKCLKEKMEMNKLYGIDIYINKEQVKIIENLFKEIEELKEKNKYLPNWVSKKYVSKAKIKAKIEELDIEIQCCEYADDDSEEYKQDIEKEKAILLREKAILQSLLEREE